MVAGSNPVERARKKRPKRDAFLLFLSRFHGRCSAGSPFQARALHDSLTGRSHAGSPFSFVRKMRRFSSASPPARHSRSRADATRFNGRCSAGSKNSRSRAQMCRSAGRSRKIPASKSAARVRPSFPAVGDPAALCEVAWRSDDYAKLPRRRRSCRTAVSVSRPPPAFLAKLPRTAFTACRNLCAECLFFSLNP